jgi:hypothetical protein
MDNAVESLVSILYLRLVTFDPKDERGLFHRICLNISRRRVDVIKRIGWSGGEGKNISVGGVRPRHCLYNRLFEHTAVD